MPACQYHYLRPPALTSSVCLPPPELPACLPAAGLMHSFPMAYTLLGVPLVLEARS